MSRNYSLSQNGVNLIKQFEGLRLTAYQDVSGVWTIGYGWTHAVNGRPISKGVTITNAQAEELLITGLQSYVSGVNAVLTRDATQNQFDAMVSLCYNIGVSGFQSSTLVKYFNQGNISGASAQFLVWNKSGGRVVQGLVNRRIKERALFDSASGSASGSNGDTTKPSNNVYVVKSGDNLSTIAVRLGTTVSKLASDNDIKDINKIYVGQKLVYSSSSNSRVYVVKNGDNLTNIAKKLGTTISRLASDNGIKDVNKIYVGQKLKY